LLLAGVRSETRRRNLRGKEQLSTTERARHWTAKTATSSSLLKDLAFQAWERS